MTYQAQLSDAVADYLQQEFTGAEITRVEDKDSYSFRVEQADQHYFVRVMFSTVENMESTEISEFLTQFSVSQTMLSLGEFPVVVTDSGCIFGSP